jgi:hypothetical protein
MYKQHVCKGNTFKQQTIKHTKFILLMHHMCTSHHLVKRNSYLLGNMFINEDKHAILLTHCPNSNCIITIGIKNFLKHP